MKRKSLLIILIILSVIAVLMGGFYTPYHKGSDIKLGYVIGAHLGISVFQHMLVLDYREANAHQNNKFNDEYVYWLNKVGGMALDDQLQLGMAKIFGLVSTDLEESKLPLTQLEAISKKLYLENGYKAAKNYIIAHAKLDKSGGILTNSQVFSRFLLMLHAMEDALLLNEAEAKLALMKADYIYQSTKQHPVFRLYGALDTLHSGPITSLNSQINGGDFNNGCKDLLSIKQQPQEKYNELLWLYKNQSIKSMIYFDYDIDEAFKGCLEKNAF